MKCKGNQERRYRRILLRGSQTSANTQNRPHAPLNGDGRGFLHTENLNDDIRNKEPVGIYSG